MNTILRNTIKTIDSRLFAGVLKKLNRARWKCQIYWSRKPLISYILQKKHIYKIHAVFKYNNNVCFTTAMQNYLGSLFDKYGSDKGYCLYEKNQDYIAGHGYNNIYELLFFQHKSKTKLVLECGIGSKNPETPSNMLDNQYSIPGGSLRAWRDYFSKAQIIGIDIDSDVMFTEDRISTYICDQTSKQSINNFIQASSLQPNTVDIIIDDGLHEFNANITLFENTKHLLTNNGIYIIEDFDVNNKEQQLFIDYFRKIEDYNIVFIRIIGAYLILITKKQM